MQALQAIAAIELIEGAPHSRRRKRYHERYDPFSLPDVEFKRRYRFTKITATYIIELVKQDLQLDSRGCGTSPELQVLTALRCWARREVQDDERDLHGLSQPTVSRTCARVARALARHSGTYIKMPQSLAEQQLVVREFFQIRNFPTVLGCINCTHIKIKKYGGDAAQYYKNRKGYYSLNVQVTCDAKLHIYVTLLPDGEAVLMTPESSTSQLSKSSLSEDSLEEDSREILVTVWSHIS